MDNELTSFEDLMFELKVEVESFYHYWMDGHKETPEQFPLDLEPGEFFEQFVVFLNSKG